MLDALLADLTSLQALAETRALRDDLEEAERRVLRLRRDVLGEIRRIQLLPGPQGPAGPAGAAGATGTTGATGSSGAGALQRLAMYFRTTTSIENFQLWPLFTSAGGSYLTASTEALGAADLALVRNASGAARTVTWRLEYTATVGLTLRVRKYSGSWSTVATQEGASGTQAYSGSVVLADGELLGAHMTTTGQSLGPFAFYLD